MDVTLTPADTAAAAGTPADTAPASDPSATASSAAATTGKTAPPVNAAREAFDALAAGQQPSEVNKAYRGKVESAKAKPPTSAQAATTPAKSKEEPSPTAAGTPAVVWPDSIDAKDKNVLQRAKMDPDVWAAIPPANRTKILNGLRTTQAEQDRQFTQSRAAAAGKGKDALPAAAAAAGTQTEPSEETDQATRADAGDGAAQQAATAAANAGQPAAAPAADPAAQPAVGSYLSPADLETLRSLGGPELAETLDRGFAAAIAPIQQQNTQLLGVVEFLLGQHVDGQVNTAAAALAQNVGMDGLRSDHADYSKNLAALKDKALLLHRAAANPNAYPIGEAVKDAAASLFKINPTQAAQAALLGRVRNSLNSAPDRGDGQRSQRTALSPGERNRAIFAQLQAGLAPAQARNAVDGA